MNGTLSHSRWLPRRSFMKQMISTSAMARVAPGFLIAQGNATQPKVSRELFVKSPGKGAAVMAFAYYTRRKGLDLMSIEQRWSRSDTIDLAYYRYSNNNGRTWTEPERKITGERRPGGTWRLHPRGGYVDPRTGRFLEIWNEGILPNDDPLEGMRQWNVFYSVSENGGKTKSAVQQIIHEGKEFGPQHPLPGVYTGKNCVMIGDHACLPMTYKDGSILLPVQISPLAPDGRLANPGGGYTYLDVAVMHGRWQGAGLVWRMSEVVKGDPARSTRGMDEATIETLADGRLIMVMRGSNDKKHELPSYRWVSYSSDGGWKWTQPEAWTDSSGEAFYSPSACSQLLRHSSGKLCWLGNINKANPRGNRPRYPFYAGEVDRRSELLKRETLVIVDDRQPEDDELLTLSNFVAREDRETWQVLVHMTRLFAFKDGWVGDAHLYRIAV